MIENFNNITKDLPFSPLRRRSQLESQLETVLDVLNDTRLPDTLTIYEITIIETLRRRVNEMSNEIVLRGK